MKNILLIIITTFSFSNCNNQQLENPINGQGNDTSALESSAGEANPMITNPYQDISNFDTTVENGFIDSLYTAYRNSKTIETTLTKDICIGDGCESYLTLKNKGNQTVLYLFKGDGGEYGFSNDQYFLQNDSLKFVRNFNVNIEDWPTDHSETLWRVEEFIYKFHSETVSCLRKTVFTKDLEEFDFTLKKTPYETVSVDWQSTYRTKKDELEQHLKRKDAVDLD